MVTHRALRDVPRVVGDMLLEHLGDRPRARQGAAEAIARLTRQSVAVG